MKLARLRGVYLSFVILLIILQIIFVKYWYEKTLDDIGFNAMNIAKGVVNAIDVDEYQRLVSEKQRNEYFYDMQDYFYRVQQQTGVKYLYVEHEISEDEIEYIFDAEKDSFGETDENSTPEAHSSKESSSTRLQTYSVWGTLISGLSPLVNQEGNVVGIVGVDVDKDFFYAELKSRIIKIALYCITMILLFYILIHRLQREILHRKRAQVDLKKTTDSLRNILNNTSQGFLTFGSNLMIEEEYSAKCEQFLGEKLSQTFFPQAIFPDDSQQSAFLENILGEILNEKDPSRRNVFFPLIPSEAVVNNLHLKMQFKLIRDTALQNQPEKYMVVLTDVTDHYLLQRQYNDEKKVLQMVVQAIVNRDDFLECIKDYRNFSHEKCSLIFAGEDSAKNALAKLLITAHTLKGGLSQLEMVNVVHALHEFESALSKLSQAPNPPNLEDLKMLAANCDFDEWLNKDLDRLKEVLGDDFLSQEPVIEESKLVQLEEKLQKILAPEEYRAVLRETRRLRYKSFKVLLQAYPQYAFNLSERLEKQIYPLTIEGGDFPVNISYYRNFTKSLVHVFRNNLDHGIEEVNERIDHGKDEFGRIECIVTLNGQRIFLTIKDDGRGVDLDTIKTRAVEKGLIGREEANALNEGDVLALMFKDGFSLKESIDDLSGRGVGLFAVFTELGLLGGQVDVTNYPGQGIDFVFSFPLVDEVDFMTTGVSVIYGESISC